MPGTLLAMGRGRDGSPEPGGRVGPSPEELALLAPLERLSLRIAEAAHRPLGQQLGTAWNRSFVSGVIWVSAGRRMRVHGLHHLRRFRPHDSVVLVANHRSFFDFFVISGVLYWRTPLSKRVLFPVRSPFFYDHPLGPIVNATLSGMRMFPPILRDRQRAAFNRYPLRRCVQELNAGGTIVGLHPEGRRNKGSNPYALLPGQPGVGRILLEATEAAIVPVFIHGLSNDLAHELRMNWRHPGAHPVDIVFGPPLDLSDLRAEGSRPRTHALAARRSVEALTSLGDAHRRSSDASLRPAAAAAVSSSRNRPAARTRPRADRRPPGT